MAETHRDAERHAPLPAELPALAPGCWPCGAAGQLEWRVRAAALWPDDGALSDRRRERPGRGAELGRSSRRRGQGPGRPRLRGTLGPGVPPPDRRWVTAAGLW